jgi:hypothetical protein
VRSDRRLDPRRRAIRSFKRAFLGCQGDGVSELALSARQVAWIEEGGGNDLEMTVMMANLAARSAKQVEYELNGYRAAGDPTGDWVGQLQGGGAVLAYNHWQVDCTHTDHQYDYCDWVGVGKRHLVELSSGRRRVVRSGAGSYPLAAVGGSRMAVVEGGAVRVLAPSGAIVASAPDPAGGPGASRGAERVAPRRSSARSASTSTDPRTGEKATSVGLGAAAALRLAGINSKLALLRGPRRLVLVRLVDGRLASLPLLSQTGQPLVDVRLTNAGLFFRLQRQEDRAEGPRRIRVDGDAAQALLGRSFSRRGWTCRLNHAFKWIRTGIETSNCGLEVEPNGSDCGIDHEQ